MTTTYLTLKRVCQRLDVSPKTVRSYIEEGLVVSFRDSVGRVAFDESAVERLEKIVRLRNDLGVNLAGIDIILRLCERLEDLQKELDNLAGELNARVDAKLYSCQRRVGQHPAPIGMTRRDVVRIKVVEDDE
jgi:MerR family transcriptional regulator/heat shock protein HspR